MKNRTTKLTIWGIIFVVAVIFFLQNGSPSVALVIFGTQTIALPVALWLILSTVIGLMISFLLQFLFGVYSRPTRRVREWDEPEDDPEFPEVAEEENRRFQNNQRSNPTKTASEDSQPRETDFSFGERALDESEEDWESSPPRNDWSDIDDDWNIEEPPPNNPRNNRPRSSEQAPDFYEVQQKPQRSTQEGSVYSYRYRAARNDSDNQEEEDYDEEEEVASPKVYDANYRVIRPPLWNLSKEENEEDDEDKR